MLKRYPLHLQTFLIGLFIAALFLCGVPKANAQFTVEGTVLDAETGESLPGVNVVEVGTQRGTTTDSEGEFELDVTSENSTLRLSFVGYETRTVPIDGRSEITVELQTKARELEGLVVTALGVERQQRSLGYATSQVEAQDLVEATESNPANLLQGNVPGLDLSANVGGPNSSASITLRGISSLAGNNNPLFIVDGMPIDNSVFGSAGQFGGRDGGSPLSIIDPGNISEISVLKGAGAAALYGSRARDGVILVNTKSGRTVSPNGFGVQYHSSITARDPMTGFTDFQSKYGKGTRGQAPTTQTSAQNAELSSWGAPLSNVSQTPQFDGEVRPYQDVVRRQGFYRTGLSQKHSIALSRGLEEASFRLSASRLDEESVVPNSGYEQTNIDLRGQAELGRLSADAKITYQNEQMNNRTFLNDPARNPNYLIAFLPANVPKSALKPGYTLNDADERVELQYDGQQGGDGLPTNPYWAVNELESDDSKNRIFGTTKLSYDFSDTFSLQAQTGLDWYSLRRRTVDAFGTGFDTGGAMTDGEQRVLESNTRILSSTTPSLTDDLSLRLDIGGSLRYRQFESISVSGSGFTVPHLTTISNTGNPQRGYGFSEEELRSIFGSASFTFREYLFLTLTTRSDWSSTLAPENNPFIYPSVSGSFVFSDVVSLPEWFNYGKLRASWGEIGGDTEPYRGTLGYTILGAHQGQTVGALENVNAPLPLSELKPTITTEQEFGVETQFFDDRLGLDLTWYQRSTVNQIIDVTTPSSSGYSQRTVNSGELQNTGIEALLSMIPVTTEDVSWQATVNFGANNSEVKSVAPGQEVSTGPENRGGQVQIAQVPGQPVNAIYGNTYVRDDQGRIVHDTSTGLPLASQEREVLGTAAPDWSLGFTNTVSYDNVSLTALVDMKWGRQIYSGTNQIAYTTGLHKNTLDGRAACDDAAGNGPYPEDCFVGEGVAGYLNENGEVEVTEDNPPGTRPSEYYGQIASNIAEEFVYDANYVRLRQLRVAYDFPSSLISGTPIQSLQLSLVGNNLLYLHETVPNVTPESFYNSAATPGFEQAGIPESRSVGASLSIGF